ncbi:MAG: SLC13 family permease [Gammaproteobacteria bacterium]|nr:SLC13 family permease [Gammaproteobacteria bacterium]
MPFHAWVAIAVTVLCLIALATTSVGTDVVMVAAITVLMLFRVVTPEQAFSGFANDSVLSIAALFVVAAGLRETGAMGYLIRRIFGQPRSVAEAQIRMMLPVASLSAFMNNTPLVATLLPAVNDWARRQGISPSKLLIPLSYAAIFGGTCTLIGTSTNLVVNGLLTSQAHLRGMGLFELAWIGVPCALIGIGYVLLASRWLLPPRVPVMTQLQDAREYTVEMMVESGSPLENLSIKAAGLRQLPGLFLVEIERAGKILPAIGPEERLQGGDRLVFAGITGSVVDLQGIKGLKPATDQIFKLHSPRVSRTLIEAVVAPSCPLIGKTIRDGKFRSAYSAVVVAVARDGRRIQKKIGDIELKPGDTLLLETDHDFPKRHENSRDFLLLRPIEGSVFPRYGRSWLAWLILLGMVLAKGLNILPLAPAAFVAAGLMILARCCTATSARKSLDIPLLITIAASFGLGQALAISGAAAHIAHYLLALTQQDPRWLLVAIYGVTMLLTEIVTHSAAAVIVFPIAFATTQALGLHFMPFAIAITMAASASFATPIGYATNLMVYGPGGYRFSDYLRFGAPLNLLMWLVAMMIIPHIWPLT